MATIILNIFGLLLVIISIFIIRRDLYQKENYTDMNQIQENVKEYYHLTEELVENFDYMIDDKMLAINNESKELEKEKNYQDKSNLANSLIRIEDSIELPEKINSDASKIMELNEIGLSKEEIARKLNKGIREIDIIIRMQRNKKK